MDFHTLMWDLFTLLPSLPSEAAAVLHTAELHKEFVGKNLTDYGSHGPGS